MHVVSDLGAFLTRQSEHKERVSMFSFDDMYIMMVIVETFPKKDLYHFFSSQVILRFFVSSRFTHTVLVSLSTNRWKVFYLRPSLLDSLQFQLECLSLPRDPRPGCKKGSHVPCKWLCALHDPVFPSESIDIPTLVYPIQETGNSSV